MNTKDNTTSSRGGLLIPALLLGSAALALAVNSPTPIPSGAKVYVAPMDGFGSYIVAAIEKKGLSIVVVTDPSSADFRIDGNAESQKAGWAKVLLTSSANSTEGASITITRINDGTVVFAYNVNKQSAYRGKQSTAEACAKHLKEAMAKWAKK